MEKSRIDYKIVRLASPGEVPACCGKCNGEKPICDKYIKETVYTGSQEVSGEINATTPIAMILALDCLMMNNSGAFEDNKFYTILGVETGSVPTGMVYVKVDGEVKRSPLGSYLCQMSGKKPFIIRGRK